MTTLICVSDTHMYKPKLPPGDIFCFAGDFSSRGQSHETFSFCNWMHTISKDFKNLIIIPGNHDHFVENNVNLFKSRLPRNAVCLIDEGVTREGISFWGSPFTPRFFNWAFMEDRGDPIKRHWDLIPENIDVLITHGPVYGILDQNPAGKCCGCKELRDQVFNRIKPKYHLFGHIHLQGSRKIKIKDTEFFNLSYVDEDYQPTNSVTVIDIDKFLN